MTEFKQTDRRREIVRQSVKRNYAANRDKISTYKARHYQYKCEVRRLMSILLEDVV